MKRFSLAALLLASGAAFAGPFGLEKGMTLGQIGGKPEKLTQGKYKLSTVPKPHSAFETYIVQVGPKTGLCWIKAIGKTTNTSVYGTEIRSAFAEMKGRLASVYGVPKDSDGLLPGSIWNEPRDWMMGLLKKERLLAAIWKPGNGSTVPSDLKSVAIFATALSTDKASLQVEYSFTNEDECESEIAKEEDDAL